MSNEITVLKTKNESGCVKTAPALKVSSNTGVHFEVFNVHK